MGVAQERTYFPWSVGSVSQTPLVSDLDTREVPQSLPHAVLGLETEILASLEPIQPTADEMDVRNINIKPQNSHLAEAAQQ